MSNKEEWNRILQIVGEEGYPTDSEFADKCVKKFSVMRNLFYVILLVGSFYIIQGGRILPDNRCRMWEDPGYRFWSNIHYLINADKDGMKLK